MAANDVRAQEWDGEDGRRFVEQRVRHERMRRRLTDRLLDAAAITTHESIVDIGCGCGETTLLAAKFATDGEVVGVDLSAIMLAEARRLADLQGLGNVRFEQKDAQTSFLAPGGFDVAISSFGVMFFADPQAAFTNVGSALRRGGRLAFLCWQDLAKSEFFGAPSAAIAAHTTLPQRDPSAPGPFSLADPERIRALLTQAGFRDIGIEGLDEPMYVGTSVEDVLAYYRSMSSVRSVLSGVDDTVVDAITQTLRDKVVQHQNTDGVTMRSPAWLVTAHR